MLAALPHVSAQPLAYLYLSQIPYTGLDLSPWGTTLYWLVLIIFSLVVAYLALFMAVPLTHRFAQGFAARISALLNATASMAPTTLPIHPTKPPIPVSIFQEQREVPRGYSSYDGFKSFATNGAISIEDIVKGLSRNIEPIYEKVEPIRENVELIADTAAVAKSVSAPTHARAFISALIDGDRVAIFAGLRQHVREGGAPEKLVSNIICLLDDAYRARIDGIVCDPDIVRLTARLDTPNLGKLVESLATAIDSSYSEGITGAKLALTRALVSLGA